MTRRARRHRPRLELIAFLAGAACLVCACGAPAAQHQGQAPQPMDGIGSLTQHAIDIFGSGPPPVLRVLTGAQAGRLPALSFTYGPVYEDGSVLGRAISYPGCEQVEGTTVAETATTVKVTVLGTPAPEICIGSLLTVTAAVRLVSPLGRRKEIQG
jgi:hypothetical protein